MAAALVASCGGYGPGFAELPAASGWERPPVRDWLINDGLTPREWVVCPRPACRQEAMVVAFEARGETARQVAATLARPDRLLAAPADRNERAKRRNRAHARAEPFATGGFRGARVLITPGDGTGRAAAVVILARDEGDRLRLLLSIAPDMDAASANAQAAVHG
ncbi:hypothetical protein QNA08_15175 [Chelatococcus sp. SYSU_G07232]|uniref:Uncharacterized protein n=1 Tax=Chelatococcus albus TaxID=3047466 RepID=A0ABT7AJM4_9HYPH|nr:hypothetical protein [Chelatococcus sp. SYSU_G07232]MDJ1159576.1 hypothetical protein [Chelatococcus sp. SYSU_G07232]